MEDIFSKASKWLGRKIKIRAAAKGIRQNALKSASNSRDKQTEESADTPPTKNISANIPENFSLIWQAQDCTADHFTLDQSAAKDLQISYLIDNVSNYSRNRKTLERFFREIPTDTATIRRRQDIIHDFVENPSLIDEFEALLPVLEYMADRKASVSNQRQSIYEVIYRLGELENYVSSIKIISRCLGDTSLDIRSDGLKELRNIAVTISEDPAFMGLAAELPVLLPRIRSVRSITLGINLNQDFVPVGATILSLNERWFTEPSLFKSLKTDAGITNIHQLDARTGSGAHPLLTPLFRDINDIMKTVCHEISVSLRKYTNIKGAHLASLRDEIMFCICTARIALKFREFGLPVCQPKLLPAEERRCDISQAANPHLAFTTKDIMPNDVRFGDGGRILIVTGPNQGGKTVFTQMIGLLHIMAQIGMFIPAESAEMSVVDGIYTHFPVEERIQDGTGKLAEESKRLKYIIDQTSEKSLILMNESLSSTSFGESLHIARGIMKAFRELGCRVVYATHLHELAEKIDLINEGPCKSDAISLVSVTEERPANKKNGEVRRTFKIVPAEPRGKSYALEIAQKHGISYGQIVDSLKKRGFL